MAAPDKPQPGLLAQMLIPLCMLSSVGLVMVLVIRPGGGPSPLVIGGILTMLCGWVGVSVLWPSRADRRCGECQADAIERLDPTSAVGLVCKQCGWSDESASGWYLAEEELEALEHLALEKRQAKPQRPKANMDSGQRPD